MEQKIVSALRAIARFHPDVKAVRRMGYSSTTGLNHCQGCDSFVQMIYIDHITPVVDPATGRRSWDEYIQRLLYCGQAGLQRLCATCHGKKTAEERAIRTKRKQAAKLNIPVV
jgi:hypothetical protein